MGVITVLAVVTLVIAAETQSAPPQAPPPRAIPARPGNGSGFRVVNGAVKQDLIIVGTMCTVLTAPCISSMAPIISTHIAWKSLEGPSFFTAVPEYQQVNAVPSNRRLACVRRFDTAGDWNAVYTYT